MARHRTHSIAFKKQVAQEYLAGESLHGLARRHDVSRNLIRIRVPGACNPGLHSVRRRGQASAGHGGHELDARGIGDVGVGARHGRAPSLNRLAQDRRQAISSVIARSLKQVKRET